MTKNLQTSENSQLNHYDKWMRIFLLFALCLLIVLLSCLPSGQFWGFLRSVLSLFSLELNPIFIYFFDHPDLGHVIAYSFLTILLLLNLKTKFYIAPLIAFLFGLSMELAQLLVPSRGSSFSDLGLNLVGICSATLLWLLCKVVSSTFAGHKNL